MNFSPLQLRKPALAALGERAENLFRDHHYRECTQVMRQFAEGVLRTILKDDRHTYSEMMRTPLVRQLADSLTFEYFRRIRDLGNEASHFRLGTSGTMLETGERHYRVRTADDAAECLKYGHGIAVWLMSLLDREFRYPDFRPLTPPRARIAAQGAPVVFNPDQQAAIELSQGRHLVLAPPGCGKTAILTERIAVALKDGVNLSDMLCLTFTNRAARGMKERIDERFTDRCMDTLYVGNLHRFCSRLLFDNDVVSEISTILDEDDVHDVIEGLLIENIPGGCRGRSLPGNAADYIMARSARLFQEANGFPEETFHRTPEFDVNKKNQDELDAFGLIKVDDFGRCIELDHAAIAAAARRYLEYKTAQHLLDFNDLLLKAWAWLDATPEACGRYAWIQVDEVQDLSPLQLDIVKKLWNDSIDRSVCVYFGDEQQAIFSFMGAKLDTLRALHKTHEIHRLYRNFRSPDYLLNMFNTYAQRVLECDPEFLPKAEKTVARPEGALRAIRTATPQSQLMLLCDLLEGRRPEETTAVIVPSNREADAVSAAFKAQDIEHFKISGSDIFRQNILKAAKAYLSVLKDDFRSAPWAQLVYRLSSKKNLSLKKIRDYLAVEFPRRGLLASDLMLYSTHDEKEPVSALEDFMRAYEGELVVFDTETTGLDIGLDEVIQIAAVKLRAGEVVERLVLYLETEREIPKMLGNIPNPMLEEYEAHRAELVTPEAGFKIFLDFVGYAPVVGHNVEYDANIVNAQYAVLKDQLRRVRGDAAGPDEDVDRTELVRRFDTLKLSHALEPAILKAAGLARLPSHKLKDLIAVLGLEGSNTHKADDDVEATVSLLRWFHAQARPLVELQRRFLSNPSVVRMSDTLRKIVLPMFLEHRNLMYRRMPAADEAILVQVFRQFIEALPNYTDDEGEIENIRKKLPLIYEYLDRVLINTTSQPTLYAQLQRNLVQINSLKEPDLCSSDIVRDRVFISTVHKAKGLEFDNVIVTSVIDGTYPFFKNHDKADILEDARKLYVAISRTKRTLVLTMPAANAWNYAQRPSRFLESISTYFEKSSA